jgi:hypothetical protein
MRQLLGRSEQLRQDLVRASASLTAPLQAMSPALATSVACAVVGAATASLTDASLGDRPLLSASTRLNLASYLSAAVPRADHEASALLQLRALDAIDARTGTEAAAADEAVSHLLDDSCSEALLRAALHVLPPDGRAGRFAAAQLAARRVARALAASEQQRRDFQAVRDASVDPPVEAAPPSEGSPLNTPLTSDSKSGVDDLESTADALSASLVRAMITALRQHADARGILRPEQLQAVQTSPAFREVRLRAPRLSAVDPASLPEDARLAFWLNVYNLMCMHGFVAFAGTRTLPRSAASGSALRIFQLHKSIVYVIGGTPLTVLEVEHAVLRASQPRPNFLGASLLLPKFDAADVRRRLAPPRAPLLSFGLASGTAFAPAVTAFDAPCVHAQLRAAARATLLETSVLLRDDLPAGRLRVQQPIQLLWHSQDLGADLSQALDALSSLLPSCIASSIERARAACRPIDVRYAKYSWRVEFRVPDCEEHAHETTADRMQCE